MAAGAVGVRGHLVEEGKSPGPGSATTQHPAMEELNAGDRKRSQLIAFKVQDMTKIVNL